MQDIATERPKPSQSKGGQPLVELAAKGEISALVDLWVTVHEQSGDRALAHSREKVSNLFARLLDSPESAAVFVTKTKANVVGMFAGAVAPHWYSDDLVGFDYAFCVAPGATHHANSEALVQAFVLWCKRRGAKQIRVGVMPGADLAGAIRLYRSMGFADAGVGFSKEV